MPSSSFKYENYFDRYLCTPKNKFSYFSALHNPLKGTFEAERWRRNLGYANGNIGIGYTITSGYSITLAVISQNPHLLPNPPLLGLTCIQPYRNACTEFRILNGLILGGDMKNGERIDIDLYTENAPCDSCAKVIEEFLNMFPKSHVNVMYKHHSQGANFCSWPAPINTWSPSCAMRFSHKLYANKKKKGLFVVNSWYVLVNDTSNDWVGMYKFLGYSTDYGVSNWEDDRKVIFADMELTSGCSMFRSKRNEPDVRLSLDPSYLEQFF